MSINQYPMVTTRFLHREERLIHSEETEMPLVIEAKEHSSLTFLHEFLQTHSAQIQQEISRYGAVLLRGFQINNEADFENTVLSIQGMQGISEAFMSEEGRVPVGELQFVLHTNAVYKTGGTLYLGGFHSENYYSTDVPSYICFCCLHPSTVGGETGLIHMEKVYRHLRQALQQQLEKNTFFVSKWLVAEVADRYQLSPEAVEKIAFEVGLPVIGQTEKFILMYKPSVFIHPDTQKKALQINLFELPTLNTVMRKYFIHDYPGKTWFWHRFVWRLPKSVLRTIEFIYIICASFFYSPLDAIKRLRMKWKTYHAAHDHNNLPAFNQTKVGSCFNDNDVDHLARLLRQHYSSCLWQKGDLLLVDNRQVAHAGMPGAGPRVVRAMIANPLQMPYTDNAPGMIDCKSRQDETIGGRMAREQL